MGIGKLRGLDKADDLSKISTKIDDMVDVADDVADVTKAVNKIDDVVDAVDDVADVAKAVEKAGDMAGVGEIKGGRVTSWADLMSPEEAAKYNNWVDLREAGLDQVKINDIILTNKGYRPDPATYLSQEYMDAHLELFSNGVAKISATTPIGQAGPPGGTFVMPKSVADDIIREANGDILKLEQSLSLKPGTLGDSPVRLDIAEPQGLRMPSGNELGANEQWLPGGRTGGGIPEATIDSPLQGEFVSTLIFE